MRRSRRSLPGFPSLSTSTPVLERRILLSLGVVSAVQDGNDYVGPDAGVGPDNIQDIHLILSGIDTTPGVAPNYITISGPSGFRWESGANPSGSANAEFYRSGGSSTGNVYFNPTIKSNTTGTLTSPGSSTGNIVSLASGDSIQVTVHYINQPSESTSITLSGLASPPSSMPTITGLPSVNTSALSVTSSTQNSTTGDVTLTVTGLSGTGLTTNFSDVLWVLSDPAGITWDSSSGSVGHEHITATVNGNTATLTYPHVRDELSALEGNPSNGTMMLTASHSAQGSTLYTSAFVGAGFDSTYGTDSLPGSTFYATSLNLATLASELQDPNSSYGTISLPANTTLTLRNPLKIAHSVKFVGNGATLLFEQLTTDPAWSSEATGAIYIASNLGPKNLRLEFENFTIRFGTASLRWKNSDNTDWYPSDSTHSAPKAVIQAREGHDSRSLDYIRLDGMKIYGPPAFDTTTRTLSSDYVDVGERAIDLLTASDYAKGSITNSEFQGGPATVFGGPWVVSNNVVKGSFAKTYSPSAFAFETPHDIQLIDNTVSQVDSLGTLFRLTNLSVCGFNDAIARNAVSGGVGTIGNQALEPDLTGRLKARTVADSLNHPSICVMGWNRIESGLSRAG